MSIAARMNDPVLYERVASARGAVQPSDLLQLARINLDIGRPDVARKWIDQVPVDLHRRGLGAEADRLRLRIDTALGDTARATETAWRIFRHEQSLESFDALVAVV